LSPLRSALLATAAVSLWFPAALAQTTTPTPAPAPAKTAKHHHTPIPLPKLTPGDVIADVQVTGNQRIEYGTIISYLLLQPGDHFAADRMDRSLRTLYATGLFADVQIGRKGNSLVISVVENPLVANIYFEGNHAIKEEDLRKELELRSRAVFTTRLAQTDQQKILNAYAAKGRYAATVEPQIVRLPQNRVNVIFKIVEGDEAKITRIVFTGNKSFTQKELRSALNSREERWWKFLSSSDQYNPERVQYDGELLRRFYIEHGYADFVVVSQAAELAPDRKSFFLTFQVNEGERYKVGKIEVKSNVPKLDIDKYKSLVEFETGDYYNGSKVQRSADDLSDALRTDGWNFIDVEPKILRDSVKHVVDFKFDVNQGPRVYIERIDISGNSITQDRVIRREFHFAEGDPYNQTLTRRARIRLSDLGYFSDVKMTSTPGSADDKTIVDVGLTEKATGELSLGGGFSTTSGALVQSGLRQHNLIGSGVDAGINATIAQHERQVDLSATDPYFLDRNLVAGADVFYLENNNSTAYTYDETRIGTAVRLGYSFNDHVSEAWTYTITDRDVSNLTEFASLYVQDEGGWSLLSQVGQTLQFDWRDSRVDPHTGFIIRAGTDYAGIGGDVNYVRAKLDGSYYIPLDRFTGNADWTIAESAGVGDLITLNSNERIIDRFFLGGDSLRGFRDEGAGPHTVAYTASNGLYYGSDSVGGDRLWTESTELRFPLPVPKDFGLSARTFVDAGGLSGLRDVPLNVQTSCYGTEIVKGKEETVFLGGAKEARPSGGGCIFDDSSPRMAAGIGFSWNSPFGLINLDFGIPILKKEYDQTQVFRFGFGTRFN